MDGIGASSGSVIVIPVGVSRYRDPPAAQTARGRRRFADLAQVDTSLASLAKLFAEPTFQRSGFKVLPAVTGTAGEINDRLNDILGDLVDAPGSKLLLVWSGHGETPEGGELRLATAESLQPMGAGDGMPPAELVNKLAASGARSVVLVLDVCQAAAAAASTATTAAQRLREAPDSRLRGLAALFSSQAFELAEEGVFAGVFERVLRNGPSGAARAQIARDGGGGFTHSRLLSMPELIEVVQVEFDLLRESRPQAQAPAGLNLGNTLRLFPNPLYEEKAAPLDVEIARHRAMRQQDLDTHFLPKARGLEPGEEGWFFTGRIAPSREIVDWLAGRGDAAAHPVYVLTGSGGTGKSALIGRLVALSDPKFRATLAAPELGEATTLPPIGSIDAALHLRNLGLVEAANALSELLEVAPPGPLAVDAWVAGLPLQRAGAAHPLTLALDALDESAEPADIAGRLIRPLGARGGRVLIGTRGTAAARGIAHLLPQIGPAHVRDLDREPAAVEDIAEYVQRRLAHTAGTPYANLPPARLAELAGQVAAKAQGRFLFARMAASGLLRQPRVAPEALGATIGDNVGEVFGRDLAALDAEFARHFQTTVRGATLLLGALAFAQGEGLPMRDEVWPLVAGALEPAEPKFGVVHLRWLLREAGRFIVESGDGEQAVYRLFHESLNEHLRAGHDMEHAEARIGAALLSDVTNSAGWDDANPFVVRHLPRYLHKSPIALENLCTDPFYLRSALALMGSDRLVDLLMALYRQRRTAPIEGVAKSLQRSRVALNRDPSQLVPQLHARLADEKTGLLQALVQRLPGAAPPAWLRSRGATLGWRAALQTMQTFGAKVRALTMGFVDGESVIAVGQGAQVLLWNPRNGALPARAVENDGKRVTALAMGMVDGRDTLAVAAAYDNTLVLRDARTGQQIGEAVNCTAGPMAFGRFRGRLVLAYPDGEGTVLWSVDGSAAPSQERIVATQVHVLAGALVALELVGDRGRIVDLESRVPLMPFTQLPSQWPLVAVGEHLGRSLFANSVEMGGEVVLREMGGGDVLGSASFGFPLRALAVGDVDGELVIAAGNDSDVEGGYVAIRQPLVGESLQRPAPPNRVPIVGIGRERTTENGLRAPRLVLLLQGMGAFDPLTNRIVAGASDTQEQIDIVHGVWQLQPLKARLAPDTGAPRTLFLDRAQPLTWPVHCEDWDRLGDRLLQARGSYGGATWIFDPLLDEIVGGPFHEVAETLRVSTGMKRAITAASEPARAVALGTWRGRGAVAIAHMGRVVVFDVTSSARIGAPPTGNSDIVAVSLGEADDRPLLATGSAGGAVTVWAGPEMSRLASITLDAGVLNLWLCSAALIVRTVDSRFHVFDLVTRK